MCHCHCHCHLPIRGGWCGRRRGAILLLSCKVPRESKSRTEAHESCRSQLFWATAFFRRRRRRCPGTFTVENLFRCFYIVQSFHRQRHCLFAAFGGICLSRESLPLEDIMRPRKRTTMKRSVTTDWGCAMRKTNRLGSCRSFVWDSMTCHQT